MAHITSCVPNLFNVLICNILFQAVDERQEEAISGSMKQLSQRENHLEENMRLANELKVWCCC
jgi:hypothetical protein